MTTETILEERIVKGMATTNYLDGTTLSAIGYMAHPDKRFRTSQGAGFSVAKLVNKLEKRKIICWNGSAGGYYLCGNHCNWSKKI